MSGGAWKVEYQDALRSWVNRHRPTLDEELAMLSFLDGWTSNGPPSVAPDASGNSRAAGPQGGEIYFRQYDLNYVLVMRISR